MNTLVKSILLAIALAAVLSPSLLAQGADPSEAALIQRGFEVAPVPLNLVGKNRDLVGLGSYIMNASSDCNSCHSAGGPPNFDYAAGGNPYFNQSPRVEPATYLGGGADFGPAGPPENPGPDIIARNLTPDKTGRPEGGHTLAEFKQILRHGTDFDHLHPNCSAAITTNCIGAPVDGDLLQIMPWPTFGKMTDHFLEAIYEYLSAIPCYPGPDDPNDPRHNDCGPPPPATPPTPVVAITVAGATVTNLTISTSQRFLTLDASKSTDPSGLALAFSWTAKGNSVSLSGANTATPGIQLESPGQYVFTVTVSDSSGASATGSVTINYLGR